MSVYVPAFVPLTVGVLSNPSVSPATKPVALAGSSSSFCSAPVYGTVVDPVSVIFALMIVRVPVALVSILVKFAVTSVPAALKIWNSVTAFSAGDSLTFVTVPSAAAVHVKPSGKPVTVKSSCSFFVSGVPS